MAHVARVGRNDPCTCGSGKKFKKCCEAKRTWSRGGVLLFVLVSLILVAGVAAAVSNFRTSSTHVGKTGGVWSPEHGHYH
jgi:hypothetical protein